MYFDYIIYVLISVVFVLKYLSYITVSNGVNYNVCIFYFMLDCNTATKAVVIQSQWSHYCQTAGEWMQSAIDVQCIYNNYVKLVRGPL